MRTTFLTFFALLVCLVLSISAVSCTKGDEEKAEGKASEAVEETKQIAGEVKEEAKEVAAAVEEKAEEVAEEAKEMGADVKEEVKEMVGETKEETEQTTGEVKEETMEGEETTEEIVIAQAPKGDPALGKEKFQQICASCHGPEGKGDGPAAAALDPKPRNLSDASYVSTLSNEHIFKTVKEGGASVGKSPLMPAWGGTLTDEDIWNVIAYIRQDICKCEYKGQ